jgi:hypothetical protein
MTDPDRTLRWLYAAVGVWTGTAVTVAARTLVPTVDPFWLALTPLPAVAVVTVVWWKAERR